MFALSYLLYHRLQNRPPVSSMSSPCFRLCRQIGQIFERQCESLNVTRKRDMCQSRLQIANLNLFFYQSTKTSTHIGMTMGRTSKEIVVDQKASLNNHPQSLGSLMFLKNQVGFGL